MVFTWTDFRDFIGVFGVIFLYKNENNQFKQLIIFELIIIFEIIAQIKYNTILEIAQ